MHVLCYFVCFYSIFCLATQTAEHRRKRKMTCANLTYSFACYLLFPEILTSHGCALIAHVFVYYNIVDSIFYLCAGRAFVNNSLLTCQLGKYLLSVFTNEIVSLHESFMVFFLFYGTQTKYLSSQSQHSISSWGHRVNKLYGKEKESKNPKWFRW